MKRFELPDENTTLRQALSAAAAFLEIRGVDDPGTDAMLLLEKASGYSRNKYFMRREEIMQKEQKDAFCEMVSKRGMRIPLQHITGEAYFYGRRFLVNGNVLIPRMDTEILAGEALGYIKPGMRALDLCTGSGCIAVTVAKETGERVTASDISEKALETAKKNAALNEADIEFIKSDMFEKIDGRFDVIISNPPYIKSKDIEKLQEEVRGYDPARALDGGEDGLDFYRIIASEGKKYLKPEGMIFLETGSDQTEAVAALLTENGFLRVRVKEDLNRLPRVVSACAP